MGVMMAKVVWSGRGELVWGRASCLMLGLFSMKKQDKVMPGFDLVLEVLEAHEVCDYFFCKLYGWLYVLVEHMS